MSTVEAPLGIFHMVPANLHGTTLYPLNRLSELLPTVAEPHRAKYRGREATYGRAIPPLGCLWNDVLHCLPVHPAHIREALAAAGHQRPPRRWFVLDPGLFRADDTVIYDPGLRPEDERFLPYTPELLARHSRLPAAQAEFYRTVPPGQPMLLFGHTPHVLYRGALDISGAPVIEA